MIHSLMATVAAAVGVGGVEFFMFYYSFGDCFEFVCVFCPAAEVTTTTEAEYGVIMI